MIPPELTRFELTISSLTCVVAYGDDRSYPLDSPKPT